MSKVIGNTVGTNYNPQKIVEMTPSVNNIVDVATGSAITLSDSADAPLVNLVAYGKSTQNGTPTPTNRVPIESLENVEVKVLGDTEQTLAIPYTLGREDMIDCASGKLTQNTLIENMCDFEWLKGNLNNNGDGTTFYTKRYDFIIDKHLCTHFKYANPLYGKWENLNLGEFFNCNSFVVCTNHSTLEEFTSWLRTENVQVLIKLAEPIETDIDIALDIHTNYPTTTIISNAELEVEYVADTKAYIDKKFEELAVAMISQ